MSDEILNLKEENERFKRIIDLNNSKRISDTQKRKSFTEQIVDCTLKKSVSTSEIHFSIPTDATMVPPKKVRKKVFKIFNFYIVILE